jgi:hypothetical protein
LGGGGPMLRFLVLVLVFGVIGAGHAGPLFDAARRGDAAAVERLVAQGVAID